MNIAEFIAMLESELDEPTPGGVGPETPFRKLPGWSSMTALMVIARIDTDYNVVIRANDLSGVNTVAELHQLVIKLSGKQ